MSIGPTSVEVISSLLVVNPAQVSNRKFAQATVQGTRRFPSSTPLGMRGVRVVNRHVLLACVNL